METNMKADKIVSLYNALNFQLTFRDDNKDMKDLLRDVRHFKLQYCLRKN